MFKLIVSVAVLTVALFANNYERGDDAYENGDIKKAVSFWQTGAKNGEVESQFMLGFLYLRGDDISPDSKKAASLLAKTFNKNDETLLITIAISYYKNMRGSRKEKLAIKQFEEAIDREGKIAQYNLGMLFVTGTGIKKDLKKGAALIKKAKKSNLGKATKAWNKYGLGKY